MTLGGRDLAATAVAGLAVLAYAANVHGWWFLGNNRWAAVVVFALGYAGCVSGGAMRETRWAQPSVVALSALGGLELALAIAAIATGHQGLLLALVVVLVVMWLGSTVRHATTRVPVS